MPSMSSNDQRAISNGEEDEESGRVRDIYALTTPDHHPQHPIHRGRPRDASWSSQSTAVSEGGTPSENFSTMSREFNALVIAGSALDGNGNGGAADSDGGGGNNLTRIGEDEEEMINPLAIVPDPSSSNSPIMGRDPDPRRVGGTASLRGGEAMTAPPSVQRVKKDEVEAKITAWQTAELAKVNNRFKREDAVINGWEGEKVQRATSRMKKVERKLEEKRARAREKMENEVAKAHRKAEERRASAEAKRGTKVARVLELANLMRAVGKPPVKRSFF